MQWINLNVPKSNLIFHTLCAATSPDLDQKDDDASGGSCGNMYKVKRTEWLEGMNREQHYSLDVNDVRLVAVPRH